MWWYYGGYPRASPRPQAVAGKHGKKFGLTWWGRQWLDAVESEGDDQRMARGRAYARAEKTFHIKLKPGAVSAKVEGNYGTYSVNIKFKQFGGEAWEKIIKRIRSSPKALGALLNNELPENVEKVCGVKLIPRELDADCSCPDYANPCKHIAAVYYVLADEIDAAPQILFLLRGIEHGKLQAALMGVAAKGGEKKAVATPPKKTRKHGSKQQTALKKTNRQATSRRKKPKTK
ncbi:SWIM zinc finger family protein [Candidatus Micrarchaeota archaeon]|nr:SWIM zinc finger family protein [Candidatus Micrarchaeota archaeon]